jgi:prevent-host-death family protein
MRTLDSNEARLHWRDVLDNTIAGEDTVITRYGRPVAAVIPYGDYLALRDELARIRAERDRKEGKQD